MPKFIPGLKLSKLFYEGKSSLAAVIRPEFAAIVLACRARSSSLKTRQITDVQKGV